MAGFDFQETFRIFEPEIEHNMNDPELCERLGIEKTESENKEDSK